MHRWLTVPRWFRMFDLSGNADPADVKHGIARLFGSAEKSIRIIGGDLSSSFYKDEELVDCVKKKLQKGVSVEIAYFPMNDKGVTDGVPGLDGVKLHRLTKSPGRHLMSVDGKHVRIEKLHKPGAEFAPDLVLHNAQRLAQEIEQRFDDIIAAEQAEI